MPRPEEVNVTSTAIHALNLFLENSHAAAINPEHMEKICLERLGLRFFAFGILI